MTEIRAYELSERANAETELVILMIRTQQEVIGFQADGVRNLERRLPITLPITVPNTPEVAGNYIRPRGLVVRWVSAPPIGYDPRGKIFIPVLRQIFYDRYKIGAIGEFMGSECMIVSKIPEVIGA